MSKAQISVGQAVLDGNEWEYVRECLNSSRLSMGSWVGMFERVFAECLGVRHALAVSSGTAALHLALAALGIGPGDEVIVPSLTFVATANAVKYVGAKPVLADVSATTWCISPGDIERAITPKTRAIIPVHLYGTPAHMAAIQKIANVYQLYVIEDAAEALGAKSQGKLVGAIGDAGCFSFYGSKTITTGEGGMVATNDDDIAARVRLLRGQGQGAKRYWHDVVGYNYRMTDLQAAIGCAQMEQLPKFLARREEIAKRYRYLLSGVVDFQQMGEGDANGNWAVAALLKRGINRDKVMEYLEAEGIETRPVFPCLADTRMYHTHGQSVARDKAHLGIVLPTHPALSDEDVQRVCDAVKEAIHEQRRAQQPVAG